MFTFEKIIVLILLGSILIISLATALKRKEFSVNKLVNDDNNKYKSDQIF